MADFWLKPPADRPTSRAGGVASGMDIIGATIESMRVVDNSNAAGTSLVDGYEEWRRLFKAGTGQNAPPNPMMAPAASIVPNPLTIFGVAPDAHQIVARQRADFSAFMQEQAKRFPAIATRDWAQFDPGQYAEAQARDADADLARLMESRPGWDKYIAAFAGAAVGSMRDPLQVGTLALGGGTGAARTVLGRILMTAVSEAAVNAGVEAAMQPSVQAWRAQAGLDSGFDQALTNIGFAGLLGGVFGAGGRGIAEVLERTPAGAAARAAMPADLRGAIDAGDMLGMTGAQKPAAVSAAVFDRAVARADMAVQQPDLPPLPMVLDELQVSRITDALAPGEPGPRTNMEGTLELIRTGDQPGTAATRPVLKFVADIGGVDPKSPIAAELQAAGITNRSMPGLFKTGGAQNLDNIPMDEARAAFGSRADIDDGNGYVSQQAFIDAMTMEVERRGEAMGVATEAQAHYERRGVDFAADDDIVLQRMADIDEADSRYHAAGPGARADTADLVRQVLERTGPVADAIVRDVVDFVRGGDSLEDAVGFALSAAAGVRKTLPAPTRPELGATPPPLREAAPIDEAELELTAELDELRTWAAEDEWDLDELAVPIDGELIDVREIDAMIEKRRGLEAVVDACPF